MKIKSKYSKEDKIRICQDYENGDKSFSELAEELGANVEVIRRWHLRYKNFGQDIFLPKKYICNYNKEFKGNLIKEYFDGSSLADLSGKYNIATSIIHRWVDKWYNNSHIETSNAIGEVPIMKSKETTFKERLEVVNWIIANNMDYAKAAEKFSLNYALVYKWTKDFQKSGEDGLKHKKRGPKAQKDLKDSSIDELEKLKLELKKERKLREELEFAVEILKKKEELERKYFSQK